jgi:hypothetical protein
LAFAAVMAYNLLMKGVRVTKEINLKSCRARLLKKIKEEQAFLSSINTGKMRIQRREPGQLRWNDYTYTEAQRSSETIAALKDVLTAVDKELFPH